MLRAQRAVRALAAQAAAHGAQILRGRAQPDGAAVMLEVRRDWRATSSSGPVAHGLRTCSPSCVAQGDPPGALFFDGGPAWCEPNPAGLVRLRPREIRHRGHRRAGVKAATDNEGPRLDPDGELTADAATEPQVRAYLRRPLSRTRARAAARERAPAATSSTPDTNFIADRHPAHPNVWLVGGGSGHGFKHGPAMAEQLADALRGGAPLPERFALGERQPSSSLRTAGSGAPSGCSPRKSRIRSREPETRKILNLPAASNSLARIRDAKTLKRAACAALGVRLRRPRALERFTACLESGCGRVATGGAGSRARLLIVARRRSPARLVIALSVAAILAVFLLYTSIAGGGTPSIAPSELDGRAEQVSLTGVAVGPVTGDPHAGGLRFGCATSQGGSKRRCRPLQGLGARRLPRRARGRGRRAACRTGSSSAKRDSMVTKCPSKYRSAVGRGRRVGRGDAARQARCARPRTPARRLRRRHGRAGRPPARPALRRERPSRVLYAVSPPSWRTSSSCLLVRHDFSFVIVADTTSRDLPFGYLLSPFWGGQAGSLMLWLTSCRRPRSSPSAPTAARTASSCPG